MNELERKIQLEGAADPDNYKMPDGRTLSEVRTANYDRETEEGKESTRVNEQRMREQYHASYQPAAEGAMEVVTNDQGIAVQVGAPSAPAPPTPEPGDTVAANDATTRTEPRSSTVAPETQVTHPPATPAVAVPTPTPTQ